ncbi:DDE family transposase [Nonomuraea fuscirosea]|uniref:DDE family transposase n=1 Tax=Nonomuraea fuscirosea TaxID=1291556 RepID=A0A2T0LNQ7_9ACTN|nr:DDE family transposase [Nonomuraea fuscirosea]
MFALGRECLADIALLRAQRELFGPVASDPTVSHLIDRLVRDEAKALEALRGARAVARCRVWDVAGTMASGSDGELTPSTSTPPSSSPTRTTTGPANLKTFGFHPMTVFADHALGGSGGSLAIVLRPGNAGSNSAADRIEATRLALAQLRKHRRGQVLIRTDSGTGTHEFLPWLTKPGRRLSYSIGFTLTEEIRQAVLRLPKTAWRPAYDADRQVRPGAWVAELTGLFDLSGWPKGMRVIARKERPHPVPNCASPTSTAAASPASSPMPIAASSPTWNSATAAEPAQRPHPLRQGHRPGQPAPAPLHPQPDLMRTRRPGLRTPHLDADSGASAIGDIARAALALAHFEHNYLPATR